MDIKHAVHTHWRDHISTDEFPESKSRIAPVEELVLDSLERIIELLSPAPQQVLTGAAVEQSDILLVVNGDAPVVGYDDSAMKSLPYAHGYRVGWNAAIDKILNDITVSLSIEAIEHLGQMRRD